LVAAVAVAEVFIMPQVGVRVKGVLVEMDRWVAVVVVVVHGMVTLLAMLTVLLAVMVGMVQRQSVEAAEAVAVGLGMSVLIYEHLLHLLELMVMHLYSLMII
jgi:hypothetical protein